MHRWLAPVDFSLRNGLKPFGAHSLKMGKQLIIGRDLLGAENPDLTELSSQS